MRQGYLSSYILSSDGGQEKVEKVLSALPLSGAEAGGSHSILFCMCYIKFLLLQLPIHLLIEARAAVLLACQPASLFGQ